MQWQEICDNPLFRNLPFKLETNRWGQIVMSPATNQHGLYQARMIRWLAKLLDGGEPLVECGIQTAEGVKVADVAWGSTAFFKKNGRANPYLEAPEIVVEILSPSNSAEEIEFKKKLYFIAGAREFWLCNTNGSLRFFNQNGEMASSLLTPRFPLSIETDYQ
ncbi:MAG: Uma2 family endonuclease [Candidatus Competibacteraceae bacterium]|nr:Uma2 family endonuclease [Candidatus Competibacteraceae bacterium]MBK8964196.1 Uma2 family endonuclease [Candidatus Competibacteraceae bacterium]